MTHLPSSSLEESGVRPRRPGTLFRDWFFEGKVFSLRLEQSRIIMGQDLTLIVMAAGMGSRFGGLKQVEGLGPHGETLLEYSLYDAMRTGFKDVIFVIRRDIESVFHERVLSRLNPAVRYRLAFQDKDKGLPKGATIPDRLKPWGTGHAMLCGLTAGVNQPCAVINADDFYGASAFQALARFLSDRHNEQGHTLVAYSLEKTVSPHGTVSRGVCRLKPNGSLEAICERRNIGWNDGRLIYTEPDGEKGVLAPDTPVSMNLLGFQSGVELELQAEFLHFFHEKGQDPKAEFGIPDFIGSLLEKNEGEIQVLQTDEQWLGVTYPEDKTAVREGLARRVAAGEYPEKLTGI